jgi:hypothetical protein
MKHVKLYENFGNMGKSPAQVLVTGDWRGITKDGRPLPFIPPATFIFQYLPPGSPIPSGYEEMEKNPLGMNEIAEEVFTMDQNGSPLEPKDYQDWKGIKTQRGEDMRNGVLRLFIDPSINPVQLKSFLQEEADKIWTKRSDSYYYRVDYDNLEGILNTRYMRMADLPFERVIVFTKP